MAPRGPGGPYACPRVLGHPRRGPVECLRDADGEQTYQALADVDLTVAPGEFVSLIGPSGCGKTTLLKIVDGLIPFDAGEVEIEGRRLNPSRPAASDLQSRGTHGAHAARNRARESPRAREEDRMAQNLNAADSLYFVGNATMLLRLAGITLLTDPNFVPKGTDVPLGYGLTTRRLTDPAMTIDELPPLEAVLLSHYHGDHFDQLAEDRLDRALPIVTTPQAAGILGERGFTRATGVETWERYELAGPGGHVRITALPGRHAPGPLEIALPDVMGSLVEVWRATAEEAPDVLAAPDLRLYITGDTIVYEGLDEIATRAGSIDLALLHLGGTRVMGVTVTMDAEQGLELLERIKPGRAAAIHYDDYEAFKSPIEEFVAAVRAAGREETVRVLERGQTIGL